MTHPYGDVFPGWKPSAPLVLTEHEKRINEIKSYIGCNPISNIDHLLKEIKIYENGIYGCYQLLVHCFEKDNFENFKILFSHLKSMDFYNNMFCFDHNIERISGLKAARYLKVMSEVVEIKPRHLLKFIISNEFDVRVLRDQLDAIGQTEDSLFEAIEIDRICCISEFNCESLEKSLLNGKLDKDWALSYLMNRYMYHFLPNRTASNCADFHRHHNICKHLGKVCIGLGANISKMKYLNCSDEIQYPHDIYRCKEYSLRFCASRYCNEKAEKSFDEVMSVVTEYISEGHEEEDNFAFLCRDLDSYRKEKLAVRLQCLFRCYSSKKYTDRLRLMPGNLFDKKFSEVRKKRMKINDELFKY